MQGSFNRVKAINDSPQLSTRPLGTQLIAWLRARHERAQARQRVSLRRRMEAAAEVRAASLEVTEAMALAEKLNADVRSTRAGLVAAQVQMWHARRHAAAISRPIFLQKINALERHLRSAAMAQR